MHRAVVPGLSLARRAYALDDLLVLFEVPVEAEEHDDVATVLEIEAVASRRRVSEQHRYLAGVPLADRSRVRIQRPSCRERSL